MTHKPDNLQDDEDEGEEITDELMAILGSVERP